MKFSFSVFLNPTSLVYLEFPVAAPIPWPSAFLLADRCVEYELEFLPLLQINYARLIFDIVKCEFHLNERDILYKHVLVLTRGYNYYDDFVMVALYLIVYWSLMRLFVEVSQQYDQI